MEGLTRLVLAQQDDFGGAGGAAGGAMAMVMMLLYFAVIIVSIVGMWKVFEKAGKPGWASIIPIYNVIVMLEIVGKPVWWFILLFIPCVNIIIAFLIAIEMAKVFGKDAAYGIGLALLPFIFYPLLGFGDARYSAPPPPA